MKRLFLLSLLFTLGFSANAQFINGIFGTVVDVNGNPLANIPVDIFVACDDSLNSASSTVYTNPNGFFGDTLYNCVSGIVYVSYTCPDGSFNQISQQFTPNNPAINFLLLCQSNPLDTCLLDFGYNPTGGDGFTYTFFPNQWSGTPPYTYLWDFGDGTTSTDLNPTHTFNQQGFNYVCVTSTDAAGLVCSFCQDVWVQGGGTDSCFVSIDYTIDPSDPLTVDFTTTVTGGNGNYSYFWNLGSGGTSTLANPTVTFPWGGPQFGCVDVWDSNQLYCSSCFQLTLQEPVDSCDQNLVTLQLGLDNFPQETSWDITDDSGNVVAASNGTYAGIPDGTVVTETACLGDGCFTFTIYDSFGDGICCQWGQGFYTLSSNGITLASGGNFDDFESTGFGFNTTDTCFVTPPPVDTTDQCIDWTLFEWPPSCDITVDDPVCGCDGVTYANSCYAEACFGIAIWTQGPCDGNGGGNNGGGGNPSDSLCTLTAGFQYFGQLLNTGEWGYAFYSDANNGAPPYNYLWEFSDGSTYTTEDVAITFPAEDSLQSYAVCLTVYDLLQCNTQVCETIVIDSTFGGNAGGNISEDGNLRPGDIEKTNGPGDPMPDVHVRLLDPAGNLIQETWTDINGDYHFFGLQLGDYYLHVDIPGIIHEPDHFKLTPIVLTIENFNFSVGAEGVSTTAINDITFADQISVFPNPAKEFVMVNLDLTSQTNLDIRLHNLLGQTVLRQEESLPSGRQAFRVEFQGLTPGIYLLSLQSGNEIFTKKILVD